MLPWNNLLEFAKHLVQHVFLLNLIVWDPSIFQDTKQPAYTEAIRKEVFVATWAKHHIYSNILLTPQNETLEATYEDFTSRLDKAGIFKYGRRYNRREFLLECTATAYLGIEYYHNNINQGPYFAVLAIAEKYLEIFESDSKSSLFESA